MFQRPKWPFKVGLPIFGVGYALTIANTLLFANAARGNQSQNWDYVPIPLVGPFIGMESTSADFSGRLFLSTLGVLQNVGALFIVLGFTLPKQHIEKPGFAVWPEVGPGGAGVRGKF